MNLTPLIQKVSAILAPAEQLVAAVASTQTGTLATIADVVLAIPQFISLADELLTDISGPQKLQAVKAAVLGAINQIDPKLTANFDKAWGLLAPAISMLVTLKRIGIPL